MRDGGDGEREEGTVGARGQVGRRAWRRVRYSRGRRRESAVLPGPLCGFDMAGKQDKTAIIVRVGAHLAASLRSARMCGLSHKLNTRPVRSRPSLAAPTCLSARGGVRRIRARMQTLRSSDRGFVNQVTIYQIALWRRSREPRPSTPSTANDIDGIRISCELKLEASAKRPDVRGIREVNLHTSGFRNHGFVSSLRMARAGLTLQTPSCWCARNTLINSA